MIFFKKLIFITLVIFLFTPFLWDLNAQEATINSQIVDKKTKDPILYATVRLKNATIGTIADEDGYFRIPIKYRTANDTLLISSIGYKNKEIPLRFLKEDEINIILLEETVEALSEVVLYGPKRKRKAANKTPTAASSVNSESIVRKAIENIPLNYPKRPHSYAAYYRDYQIQKGEYTNLNEALIEMYDGGFQTSQYNDNANQAKILQYKRNLDFKIDSSTAVAYDNKRRKFIENARLSSFGGNELSILNAHNPIRNFTINTFSAVNTFKDDFIHNHFFSLIGNVFLDDIELYHIKFISINKLFGINFLAEGELYIEHDNFAIHKFEYAGYRQKKIEAYSSKDARYVKESDPFFTVKLEYSRIENTMYLNYISFNNIFKIRSRKDFKVNNIVYDNTENTITFTFSNAVDRESVLKEKNYKLSYLKETLDIENIELINSKNVKLTLGENTIPKGSSKESTSIIEDLSLSFNNILPISVNATSLKVEDVRYQSSDNAFIIKFNSILNPITANKTKNYDLVYKEQKLEILNIELLDKNTIKVVTSKNETLNEISSEKSSEELVGLRYKLNNIRDTEGRKINKVTRKTVDQFRELFVQKVFPSKELPRSLLFMKKTTPLSENRVLNVEDDNLYWINSPLKEKRGENKKRKK